MYRCSNFSIKELVSPVVYQKWGEQAWIFFDEKTLADLDKIRDTWKSAIIINNWSFGGSLKQCGLRSNLDLITKDNTLSNKLYLSAHTMGGAFDLHDKLGRNQKLYEHVLTLLKSHRLNSFKRLENWEKTRLNGGWVHVDKFQCIKPDTIIF